MTGRQVRGKGEGTISQRKDGRWEVRVSDPLTGKRRSGYAKTQAQARRLLRDMVTSRERGQPVAELGLTLEQYSKSWFADHAARGRAPSTVREYQRRMDKYVIPALGRRKLRSLTPLDVEQMLEGLAEDRSLSRSSLKGVQNALAAMLSDAVRSRQLRSNVARDIRLPLLPQKQAESHASTKEVKQLLLAAESTDLEELLLLVAFTGCRIGEALGMQWGDLDLDAGVWQLRRTTTINADGKVVVGDRTKTGESRRVPLTPELTAALTVQRKKVLTARLKAGKLWQEHDLVFPTSVGTPQDARNLRKEFREIAAKSGYRHSFHELRHHFATVAASEVALASLAKVLGHKQTSTTSDMYGHLYEPDADSATTVVAEALGQTASG